jgi:hypothetical protein
MLSTAGLEAGCRSRLHRRRCRHKGFRDESSPVVHHRYQADWPTNCFRMATRIGKVIYFDERQHASTIVGVVERLQSQGRCGTQWIRPGLPIADVADPPGCELCALHRACQAGPADRCHAADTCALCANRMRVLDPKDGVRSFAQIRARAYRQRSRHGDPDEASSA